MNEEMKEGLVKSLGTLGGFLLALLLIWMLSSGCTRRMYVPVESVSVRTDTVTQFNKVVERDTITRIERIVESRVDSIAPILDSIGRMIGYDRWHIIDRTYSLEETNARLTATIDSLKSVKQDSVKIKESYPVERDLSRWEKVKMDFGGMAMGASGVLIVALIVVAWIVVSRRRK